MLGSLQIKGSKYYAVFRVNGKQKWISTGIDTKPGNKKRAEKAMIKIISEYEEPGLEKGNDLFVEYLSRWLVSMKGILKPSTWEDYDKRINGKIIPYFQKYQYTIFELQPSHFTQFFLYLKNSGRSDGTGGLKRKTVADIKCVLYSALEDAVQNNIIKTNPVKLSKMPAFENEIRKEVTVYTPQEVKRLLDFARESNSHIYPFLVLALFTGLRKGEMMALQWSDIDFDKKIITINKNRTGTRAEVTRQINTPKTEQSNRKIPLADEVIQVLAEEKEKQDQYEALLGKENFEGNFVIRNIDGQPYSNLSAVNRVVNRLIAKAGLEHCTIHGFRHTVASILDSSGTPLRDISVLLGHKSVATTEKIYISRIRTAKQESINTISQAISLNNK